MEAFKGIVLILCVVVLSCEGLALTNRTTTPPPVNGCMHDGKLYAFGESVQPTPCEHCFCDDNGYMACVIADCFFVLCVDSIQDPNQCCPVCPNGQNCKAPDGTIIKAGDVYKPDENTVCECPQQFLFDGPVAQCAVSVAAPTVNTHVDPVIKPIVDPDINE